MKHFLMLTLSIAVMALVIGCNSDQPVSSEEGLVGGVVTFDPTAGTGFVGKGDVQTVLGLNNAQIQAQAGDLTFTYKTVDTYRVVNAWATGNVNNPVSLNYHTTTVTTTVNVNATVAYDPRQVKGQKQVTGFNLTGFGTMVVDGTIPVVSPTVTYVTFTWDEQVWTGEWTQVPKLDKNGNQVYDKDGNPVYVNGEKIYVTVAHTTDQLPAYPDANGNLVLYSEGNNKAVLSVTLLDSNGGLYVNNVPLPITPIL